MLDLVALGWLVALLDWEVDNLTYRGQGSYRFNFAQRRSLVLACDVEIVSVVKQPYESLKSLPPNAHYGFAVLFHGSTPFKRIDLEFPVTRIFYARNDVASTWVSSELATIRTLQGISTAYDCLSPTSKGCSSLGLANPEGPILPGHPETIVKVKVPETSQFNIIAYWIPIPDLGATNIEIDGSDGSDDLDEFPRPRVNDPNNPFQGNPDSSPPNPDSDPRDFSFPPGTEFSYSLRVTGTLLGGGGSPQAYDDFIGNFSIPPLALPLTVDASDTPLITTGGITYFAGVVIRNRFGGIVTTYAPGVGFPKGGHSVFATLVS